MKGELAIIGGSGVDKFVGWQPIDTQPCKTAYGEPSADIQTYRCEGTVFHFLARHGRPHRIPPHCVNYRANLFALHERGVGHIVAINAVGGINPHAKAGALLIPDQIIDYTYGREHTFYGDDAETVQHIDFSEPYSQSLRGKLLQAANAAGLEIIDGGVYGATQGPRLESAAEIRRLERDGCDVVGMTGMPEAALARELGIHYASLCIVVNAAAGKCAESLTVDAMNIVMNSALIDLEKILGIFLARLRTHNP